METHHFLTVTKKFGRHHFIGMPSECVLEREGGREREEEEAKT